MHLMEMLKDWQKEQQEKLQTGEHVRAYQEAVKAFQQQRIAIDKIRDTEGFKEIVAYFTRLKDSADAVITSKGVDKDTKEDAISDYRSAKKFLMFLNNIASK